MKTLSLKKKHSATPTSSSDEVKKSGDIKKKIRKRSKSKADRDKLSVNGGYDSSEEETKKKKVPLIKPKTPLVNSGQQTVKISQLSKEIQTIEKHTKEASTITDKIDKFCIEPDVK